MRQDQTALFQFLNKFFFGINAVGLGGPKGQGFVVHLFLNFVQKIFAMQSQAITGCLCFGPEIPARQFHFSVLEISESKGNTDGHSSQFVMRKFPTRPGMVFGIHFDPYSKGLAFFGDLLACFGENGDAITPFVDGDYDHLHRGQNWRQYQAFVVRMRHDQGTHQSGGDPPRGRPNIFPFALGIGKLDVKGFGKILSQKMGGTGLQGFAVLHKCFDAKGFNSSCKTFLFGFDPFDDRHRHPFFGKVGVDI